MEKLQEIVANGLALAEKRSWLEKGYQDLLEKINAELAKIPDMKEASILFRLREWETRDASGYPVHNAVTVVFDFEGDASLRLRYGYGYEANEGDWKWNDNNNPSIGTIREFGLKLSAMMDYYLEEIKRRNLEDQSAIDIIEKLLQQIT